MMVNLLSTTFPSGTSLALKKVYQAVGNGRRLSSGLSDICQTNELLEADYTIFATAPDGTPISNIDEIWSAIIDRLKANTPNICTMETSRKENEPYWLSPPPPFGTTALMLNVLQDDDTFTAVANTPFWFAIFIDIVIVCVFALVVYVQRKYLNIPVQNVQNNNNIRVKIKPTNMSGQLQRARKAREVREARALPNQNQRKWTLKERLQKILGFSRSKSTAKQGKSRQTLYMVDPHRPTPRPTPRSSVEGHRSRKKNSLQKK